MPESSSTRHREALTAQLGGDRNTVRWDDNALTEHSRDTWCISILRSLRGTLSARPLCVVSPTAVDQVCALVEYANQHRLPVVPFGAGSGVCGGVLPPDGAIVVDLRRMNRILELNDTALFVRVQAGMMGNAFEVEAERSGLLDGTLSAIHRRIHRRRLGIDAGGRPVLDALRLDRGHSPGPRGGVA